jgi:hypothetical protein
MPRGTTPVTAPCSARPTITPTMLVESPAMTEPSIRHASSAMTMRLLPYMSPRRPAIGVMTAAVNSVAVTTHAVSSREALSSSGSFAWMGTTSVYMNDAQRPARARTATIAPCGGIRVRRFLSPASREPTDSGYRRARTVRATGTQ